MISQVFSIFAGVCLPILLVTATGWLTDRKFKLDLSSLVKLNIYLFVPAFIFVRVYASDMSGPDAGRVIGFTVCMILLMFAVSSAVAAATKAPPAGRRSLYLATMFYNCGNYGIPLITLAFGEAAQGIQVFVLMTMNISTFSLGLLLASGAELPPGTPGWKRFVPVLRQPSIYAITAALLLKQLPFDLATVAVLWEPLQLIASGLVPVALVTLGVQLSHTKPPAVGARLGTALGIRLVLAPLLAYPLTMAFGFPPQTAAVLIVGTAAPTAINIALIAHEFKADSRFASAAVFWSTLISVVTVTATLALVSGMTGN